MELSKLAGTGIEGLDDVLRGGLPRERMYLIQGSPGVGKTTLAMQFLLEGARRGERVLYITLAESKQEICDIGASHGWSLDGVEIHELSAVPEDYVSDDTLFAPSEVDLREVTEKLLSRIEPLQPDRVVFDSLSEIRLLAQDALRYRRQIVALKQYFSARKATVLLLDDLDEHDEKQVQSLVHGVIVLQQSAPEYGAERRRLHLSKLRGVAFRGGYHDYRIHQGGVRVHPRLVALEHRGEPFTTHLDSGNKNLDQLLGGGIAYGSSTLIVGPAGSAKTTLCAQFAASAAAGGQNIDMYTFEENPRGVCARADAVGLGLTRAVDAGRLQITKVDPAELTPGEFAHRVRASIEERDTRVVIIDGLNGYISAMPEERFITLHMRELLDFLSQRGVATFLVLAHHGLVGTMQTPTDISYISDSVILIRFFEAFGEVRKAISVLKRRDKPHETSIRELRLGAGGVEIGERLQDFHGVLTGVPVYRGAERELMRDDGAK